MVSIADLEATALKIGYAKQELRPHELMKTGVGYYE